MLQLLQVLNVALHLRLELLAFRTLLLLVLANEVVRHLQRLHLLLLHHALHPRRLLRGLALRHHLLVLVPQPLRADEGSLQRRLVRELMPVQQLHLLLQLLHGVQPPLVRDAGGRLVEALQAGRPPHGACTGAGCILVQLGQPVTVVACGGHGCGRCSTTGRALHLSDTGEATHTPETALGGKQSGPQPR